MEFLKQVCLVSSFVAIVFATTSQAKDALPNVASEYEVKAAFVYKFKDFVEWSDAENVSELRWEKSTDICVVGVNPFGKALEEIVRSDSMSNTASRVVMLDSNLSIHECKLAFISRSERFKLPKLMEEAKKGRILTISDIPSFAEIGGMIELTIESDRVGFVINEIATKQARIKISSKLLRLASKVIREE